MRKYVKFLARKLVRDEIPRLMEMQGVKCQLETLTQRHQFLYQLKRKLVEESHEVFSSKDMNSLIEEISDVMDIIYLIMRENRISMEAIIESSNNKKKSRGGFDKRLFLHNFEVDSESELVEKYRKSGYQEIVSS